MSKFQKDRNIRSILWLIRNPDINIAEYVWKMISDIVYDGSQFHNKEELVETITSVLVALIVTTVQK